MATEEYTLRFMPIAADDLDSIYDYISNRLSAQQAAHNLMKKMEECYMHLKTMPHMGTKCLDEYLNKKGYRKLIVDNFITLYKVDDEKKIVTVMRVIYGRRQYEKLL